MARFALKLTEVKDKKEIYLGAQMWMEAVELSFKLKDSELRDDILIAAKRTGDPAAVHHVQGLLARAP